MARKKKAFEEEGAVKMPSNTEVAKFQERIIKLREKRRKQNASVGIEIGQAKEDADNSGIDVKTMMLNIKLIEMGLTPEEKKLSNIYFDKTGQQEFFFVNEDSEEETEAA